jgi:hypothetical protein
MRNSAAISLCSPGKRPQTMQRQTKTAISRILREPTEPPEEPLYYNGTTAEHDSGKPIFFIHHS